MFECKLVVIEKVLTRAPELGAIAINSDIVEGKRRHIIFNTL